MNKGTRYNSPPRGRAKLSIREKLQEELERRGWEVDAAHPTSKYVAMKASAKLVLEGTVTASTRYFIGMSGALRGSAQGMSTCSIPMPKRKASLLAAWEEAYRMSRIAADAEAGLKAAGFKEVEPSDFAKAVNDAFEKGER